MASKFLLGTQGGTDASANFTFDISDTKRFTGRLGSPDGGTFNYEVRLVLTPEETASQGYLLQSGTGVADALFNCNDGDGQPVTGHAIYVAYSSLTATKSINVGVRIEF